MSQQKSPRTRNIPYLLLAFALSAFVAGWNDTSEKRLLACYLNQKNLSTSLEMYATDYSGQYPQDLQELVPAYAPSIPHCPSAERDTYSSGYETGLEAWGNRDGFHDYYYISCEGDNHADAGARPNRPHRPQVGCTLFAPDDWESMLLR